MITLSAPNWKLDDIETILFDKDGTLIDSHIYWGRIIEKRSRALIEMLALRDTMHPLLCGKMGFSLDKRRLFPAGPIALVSREKVIDILVDFLRHEEIAVDFSMIDGLFIQVHKEFLKEIKSYIRILPGVEAFLKKVKDKKVKTAVVTTDSIRNTREIMRFLRIDKHFDLLLGKEATPLPKISGEPALIALEQLNAKADTTITIGDTEMDVSMAEKARLKAAVAVALGQVPYEELSKVTCHVANNYDEMRVA